MSISKIKVGTTDHDLTAARIGVDDIGSATQPVYIDNGVPKATTYTLGKSVPSDAKFTDTVYTLPTASSSTLGGVKIGSNINISSGKISVPTADGSTAGVTVVYPAASCTTFSSDSGTVTPAAVQKGAKMFAITRPTSSTNKAITRYSNTTGDVQDSKIIIEDVTNTRDTSKKAQVIAIPAEGGKKMVYGYCTDQVDGTSFIGGVFDADATSYPYAQGLAIGGTSGNLLWKGSRVIDASCIGDFANKYTHPSYTARTGVPTANATPAFGGTFTVSQPVSDATGHITAINSRTITIPSSAATTSAAGLMSAADKTKLDGIATGANNYTYTLPNATSSVLGGVKIGSNISISSGTISLSKANVTSALGYTPPTTNTTYSNFVKSGSGAAAGLVPAPSTTAGTTKYLREDGTWQVPPNTTYSAATTSANGLMSSTDKINLTNLITQVTTLESDVAGKAASSHTHAASAVTAGTFPGNVVAYSTNRSTSGLRNIEVRKTSASGTLQSTNKIIMVRA